MKKNCNRIATKNAVTGQEAIKNQPKRLVHNHFQNNGELAVHLLQITIQIGGVTTLLNGK